MPRQSLSGRWIANYFLNDQTCLGSEAFTQEQVTKHGLTAQSVLRQFTNKKGLPIIGGPYTPQKRGGDATVIDCSATVRLPDGSASRLNLVWARARG